ncbi:class E sortase [Streptomyces ficellus]|uniref:Class E sortase n=1 Tax=Streptomyces ficellus TaxID=1977088 RepID=A0A6I6FS18_9ACTN|nr:class E sortase [Streptomyces ficellus]QGV79596.1 class E sortase [Streptomyces ficellus]
MRLVVRSLSELCITAGTVIVLFVVYVVHWTGVQAGGATAGEIGALERRWADAPLSPVPPRQAAGTPAPAPPYEAPPYESPPYEAPPYEDGEPFAVMYVPRFGADWDWPVLQGTAAATLKKGLGHYAATARLGGTGNFAVAGHRRTYGDPFKDFPALRPGDAVILNDGTTWFTYRVAREPYRTVPGDTGVVDPVPAKAGFGRPGRYLTLTTCDPEWGSSHRLIAWARLEGTRPVTQGKPPAFHR